MLLVLALLVSLAVLGVVVVPRVVDRDTYSPVLREVSVEVPGLTREVDVLQVTDLGGCRFGPRQSKLAALVDGKRFDAAVLTGDILGAPDYEAVWELAEVVKSCSNAVWYLPGNHDRPAVGTGLAERGVPTLPQDRSVALIDTDPEQRDVALVYGRSADTIAVAEGSGRKLLVIASHTPPDDHRLAAAQALGQGVHLFVSGHTHGGQIRLPLIGAIWAPLSWSYEQRAPTEGNEVTFLPELRGRFVDGMYVRQGQRVFVSRGLEQYAGGRPRFLARAEMVHFRFLPSKSRAR